MECQKKNIIKTNLLYLLNILPKCIKSVHILMNKEKSYNIYLYSKVLIPTIYILLSNIGIQTKMFSDLLIADYPNYSLRFLSIYNCVSIQYNIRLILKLWVETNLVLESITNMYTCASWFEREAWDMYGVFYSNNLDLRRILNDYGFNGHPLKKDYPLSGFTEAKFSYISGVSSYTDIKMTQEYRFFNITSPWKYNTNLTH